MSNFNQSKQSVSSQFNAVRDIVNNYIHPPIETIKAAWSFTSKCFHSMLPDLGKTYSKTVQFEDDQNNKEIIHKILEAQNRCIQLKEEENKFKKEDIKLKEVEIKLKEIENELKLEENKLRQEKFDWEKSVVQENLELIRRSHVIDLEQKRKELQSEMDWHYLPLQGCREDIIEFLFQEDGKFIIIPSPPEILRDDIQAFKSLKAEIPPKLKRFIEKYYGGVTESVISCKNIFNNHIEDVSAATVGKFISPIPTLIFHSKVTNQKVFISITLTCPSVERIPSQTQTSENQYTIRNQQETFLLPEWNWMELKKELESQGQDFDTSTQTILDLITNIHLIVTLYFSDLYYLNLNPNHSPKLFEFIDETDFPDSLREWTRPLQNSLEDTQKQIQAELDKIRALQTTNVKKNHASQTELTAIPIVFGLGLALLIGVSNQQSPNITTGNIDNQNWIEQGQNRTGIIQVNRPSNNPVNLRVTPNGKVIRKLQNGTPVIIGKFSNDGQWLHITTKDEKSGWVWAKFVQ
ncbi:MAG: SH3 domain-containing protein [Rivularia sp. (in: cyanobacteria)]